jgi:hypothetical protein
MMLKGMARSPDGLRWRSPFGPSGASTQPAMRPIEWSIWRSNRYPMRWIGDEGGGCHTDLLLAAGAGCWLLVGTTTWTAELSYLLAVDGFEVQTELQKMLFLTVWRLGPILLGSCVPFSTSTARMSRFDLDVRKRGQYLVATTKSKSSWMSKYIQYWLAASIQGACARRETRLRFKGLKGSAVASVSEEIPMKGHPPFLRNHHLRRGSRRVSSHSLRTSRTSQHVDHGKERYHGSPTRYTTLYSYL